MNGIAIFLLLTDAGSTKPTIDIPILAVVTAFRVIVGAALTRFSVEPRIFDRPTFA